MPAARLLLFAALTSGASACRPSAPVGSESATFLGLRTAIYHVSDIAAARNWYADALGIAPYFDEPFYVGFNVGGYELGLDPDTSRVKPGAAGAVVYWGVSNADSTYARLVGIGARSHSPVQEVGGGVRVGSVLDPFGNVLGVIENPDFAIGS